MWWGLRPDVKQRGPVPVALQWGAGPEGDEVREQRDIRPHLRQGINEPPASSEQSPRASGLDVDRSLWAAGVRPEPTRLSPCAIAIESPGGAAPVRISARRSRCSAAIPPHRSPHRRPKVDWRVWAWSVGLQPPARGWSVVQPPRPPTRGSRPLTVRPRPAVRTQPLRPSGPPPGQPVLPGADSPDPPRREWQSATDWLWASEAPAACHQRANRLEVRMWAPQSPSPWRLRSTWA